MLEPREKVENLESLAELVVKVVVSESALESGYVVARMCSWLLNVEMAGLERRVGRDSGNREARGLRWTSAEELVSYGIHSCELEIWRHLRGVVGAKPSPSCCCSMRRRSTKYSTVTETKMNKRVKTAMATAIPIGRRDVAS